MAKSFHHHTHPLEWIHLCPFLLMCHPSLEVDMDLKKRCTFPCPFLSISLNADIDATLALWKPLFILDSLIVLLNLKCLLNLSPVCCWANLNTRSYVYAWCFYFFLHLIRSNSLLQCISNFYIWISSPGKFNILTHWIIWAFPVYYYYIMVKVFS